MTNPKPITDRLNEYFFGDAQQRAALVDDFMTTYSNAVTNPLPARTVSQQTHSTPSGVDIGGSSQLYAGMPIVTNDLLTETQTKTWRRRGGPGRYRMPKVKIRIRPSRDIHIINPGTPAAKIVCHSAVARKMASEHRRILRRILRGILQPSGESWAQRSTRVS